MDDLTPNIRNLEAFLAVLHTRSFSLAGEQLGIAQPTVTQRVQALEQTLGARLFDRQPGDVRPTPAGAALVTYAERFVDLRDELARAMTPGAEIAASGTLRIAASSVPGDYVMPAVLQRFHHDHPQVRLQMSISDSHDVVERLFDGEAELGLVGDVISNDQLICQPFLEDEIVVVVPPDHVLAHARTIGPAQLAQHRWIVREPGSATRHTVEGLLTRDRGTSGLKVAMQIASTEAIKRAVRLGAGVALLSHRAVEAEAAAGVLVTRRIGSGPGLRREICAVRVRGRTFSRGAELMWDQLVGSTRARRS